MTAYVSNGNGTPQVLDYIRPWIDLYKVDLKSFDDRHYRQLGGRIEPILSDHPRAARDGHLAGDRHAADPRLQRRARRSSSGSTAFLAGVSPDIPWHVTAFHKDYRMNDPENTTPEMLMRAAEIGRRNGLRYVYAGQPPGTGRRSRTHALPPLPRAARRALRLLDPELPGDQRGACPDCGTAIPGRWGAAFDGQITSTPFLPGRGVAHALTWFTPKSINRRSREGDL